MNRLKCFPVWSGVLLLALSGCSENKDAASTPPTAPPGAADRFKTPAPDAASSTPAPPADATGKSAMPADGAKGAMPGTGTGMTAEEALEQVPANAPELAPMQKAMSDSEAALKKSPDDPKAKAAYVNAAYTYGHAVMLKGQPSKIMYRGSLALLRRALKVDPTHKPSLADKKTIEDIYVGMGIPIPQ